MLVCNVSMRAPRRAIAADLAEIATALDAPGTGNIVFATLVDDPASVNDIIDAFTGEIMLEPATASDAVDSGLAYSADIIEATTSGDTEDASVTAAPTGSTWNPADRLNITLSGGNLTAACSSASPGSGVRSVTGYTTGKYYWEATMTGWIGTACGPGVALSSATYSIGLTATGSAGLTKAGGGTNGAIYVNGSAVGINMGFRSSGEIVGIAVDIGAQLIWFRIAPSGNWNNSGTANPATGTGGISISSIAGTLHAAFLPSNTSDICTANFGATSFSGAVPSGFTAGWP